MNVVLIEADQLSAKWLGCYGNASASTPNLDRLAASGIRFNHAYSPHPVCMPARASALTGRSAHHHGVFTNGWELDASQPTFVRCLQAAGVQTFGVGKFHLECHGRSAYNDVRKYGFDRAEVTEDIRAGDWLDWVESTSPEHAAEALSTVWPMPHLQDYGPSHRNLLADVKRTRERFAGPGGAFKPQCTPIPEDLCQTHWIVERALTMMAERDRGRPFFLKVSFVDPHDPYDPPERFVKRIAADRIPLPVHSEDAAIANLGDRLRDNPFVARAAELSAPQWVEIRQHYLASVAFLDEQVGRLLAAIEAAGIAGETAVIFTADHGDMLGDHGLPTKGSWHFDACLRIPLLLAGPGIPAGLATDRVATLLDLFPTVCDLAAVPVAVPIEGSPLHHVADGSIPGRPDAALVETYGAYGRRDGVFRARSVVTPKARFTRFGDGHTLLFDLTADPDETRNLAGTAAGATLERQMLDALLALWDRQNDPLPGRSRHPLAGH